MTLGLWETNWSGLKDNAISSEFMHVNSQSMNLTCPRSRERCPGCLATTSNIISRLPPWDIIYIDPRGSGCTEGVIAFVFIFL